MLLRTELRNVKPQLNKNVRLRTFLKCLSLPIERYSIELKIDLLVKWLEHAYGIYRSELDTREVKKIKYDYMVASFEVLKSCFAYRRVE